MKLAASVLIVLGFGCTAAQPPRATTLADLPKVHISTELLWAEASLSPEGQSQVLYLGADTEYCYFSLFGFSWDVKIARHELVLHNGLELLEFDVHRKCTVRLDRQESLHLWAVRDPQRKRNSVERFLEGSLPAAIQGALPESKDESAGAATKP